MVVGRCRDAPVVHTLQASTSIALPSLRSPETAHAEEKQKCSPTLGRHAGKQVIELAAKLTTLSRAVAFDALCVNVVDALRGVPVRVGAAAGKCAISIERCSRFGSSADVGTP